MKTIKSCEFNMDTGCVELRFQGGSMISIDCTAVENEVADNRFQRSELDYLIYNDPLAYALDFITFRNADHHIIDQGAVQTVQRTVTGLVGRTTLFRCPLDNGGTYH